MVLLLLIFLGYILSGFGLMIFTNINKKNLALSSVFNTSILHTVFTLIYITTLVAQVLTFLTELMLVVKNICKPKTRKIVYIIWFGYGLISRLCYVAGIVIYKYFVLSYNIIMVYAIAVYFIPSIFTLLLITTISICLNKKKQYDNTNDIHIIIY